MKIRIRIWMGILALLLCAAMTGTVLAADGLPRLVDNADLLSEEEEAELFGTLDEISERHQVDIVVVTESSIGGASAMEYADDFFDYNGYGMGEERDGILLLVSMEERDWHISTSGYGIVAFTDAGLDYMSGRFVNFLSSGDYATAFRTYAALCDDFLIQAESGVPYDVNNLPETPFGTSDIITSFVVAFVIAFAITWLMRRKLKSVRSERAAKNYIIDGSMELTTQRLHFLFCHVDRRVKPKGGGSSTHTSSSGRRHGGRGGRF